MSFRSSIPRLRPADAWRRWRTRPAAVAPTLRGKTPADRDRGRLHITLSQLATGTTATPCPRCPVHVLATAAVASVAGSALWRRALFPQLRLLYLGYRVYSIYGFSESSRWPAPPEPAPAGPDRRPRRVRVRRSRNPRSRRRLPADEAAAVRCGDLLAVGGHPLRAASDGAARAPASLPLSPTRPRPAGARPAPDATVPCQNRTARAARRNRRTDVAAASVLRSRS